MARLGGKAFLEGRNLVGATSKRSGASFWREDSFRLYHNVCTKVGALTIYQPCRSMLKYFTEQVKVLLKVVCSP